jgi:uncharacterized membrane protein
MLEYFEFAVVLVEVAAVLLLLTGLTLSTAKYLQAQFSGDRLNACQKCRRSLGQTLLLTSEFLIAANILETVTIDRTMASAGLLAILVVVRTFLSFAFALELTGRWPWQVSESAGERGMIPSTTL